MNKLRDALAGTIGKSIDRVFVTHHPDGRSQIFLVFTDGTYYEFYGRGGFEGTRCVYDGDAATVRARLSGSGAEVIEVPTTVA